MGNLPLLELSNKIRQMARERGFECLFSSNPKVYFIEQVIEQLDVLEALFLWEQGLEHISGLVTGCFDILHPDQVEFLQAGKRKVQTLIVGVDRDETVRLKGPGRPIFNLRQRCEMLAALDCVDLVFPIPFALGRYEESPENATLFEALTDRLFNSTLPRQGIHCLITNEAADPFWREKKERAEKLGVGYIGLNMERSTSSSQVATKIQTGG